MYLRLCGLIAPLYVLQVQCNCLPQLYWRPYVRVHILWAPLCMCWSWYWATLCATLQVQWRPLFVSQSRCIIFIHSFACWNSFFSNLCKILSRRLYSALDKIVGPICFALCGSCSHIKPTAFPGPVSWDATHPRQLQLFGWRHGSVVRMSVFEWRTFPDLRLFYGRHVTTSWVKHLPWVNQLGQLSLPSLWGQ